MDTTSAITFLSRTKTYLGRVIRAESTKKGVAAAGAGFLMSLILEAAWPTRPAI